MSGRHPALTADHARIALGIIWKWIKSRDQFITDREAELVGVLRVIISREASLQRATSKVAKGAGPLSLPVGSAVLFKAPSSGRNAPSRNGTVCSYRIGTWGVWVEISEFGADEGVTVWTQFSNVAANP